MVRQTRCAGGVGVRAELFPPKSPVFSGIYCTTQEDVLYTSELKAALVSRAQPVLPVLVFLLYFPLLKLIF